MSESRGLLIINLGTPNSPSPDDVGNYLKEFLMDKHVITLPYFLRWPLVNWMIVPKRKFQSAGHYQTIWSNDTGSPLLHYSKKISEAITKGASQYGKIALGMRYGSPSIKDALTDLSGCSIIDVVTLYPHLTGSSVTTAIEKTKQVAKEISLDSKLKFLPVFYNQSFYIDNLSNHIKKELDQFQPDHFLFSYHGIPKEHLREHCSNFKTCNSKCEKISEKNENCYRAQCFETSRLLAEKLNLEENQYTTTFQSRLGKAEWIRPYISESLELLSKRKISKLALISPSFVVDCLETVEELAILIKDDYQKLVPESQVKYLACLNDHEGFSKDLSTWSYETSNL